MFGIIFTYKLRTWTDNFTPPQEEVNSSSKGDDDSVEDKEFGPAKNVPIQVREVI